MNRQIKETADRDYIPENYRNPGNSNAAGELSPSTRELLGVLSNIGNQIAA
ncbi:MAG: hypothetical protein HKN11_09190 [Rhizobiales bacterium]|nr:hypothetical protein [Hyphomicrobiales bacterium]